jgi:hypothetical protein
MLDFFLSSFFFFLLCLSLFYAKLKSFHFILNLKLLTAPTLDHDMEAVFFFLLLFVLLNYSKGMDESHFRAYYLVVFLSLWLSKEESVILKKKN